MTANCPTCNKGVTETPVVCGGFCKSEFHAECCSMSSTVMEEVHKSKHLFWMCNSCTKLMNDIRFRASIQGAYEAGQEYVLSAHTEIVGNLKQKIMEELKNEIRLNFNALINSSSHTPKSTTRSRAAPLRSRRLFQKPETQKRQDDLMRGTGGSVSPSFGSIAVAAPKERFWLYLSRISRDVTADQIRELAKRRLDCDDVEAVRLVAKGRDVKSLTFISFKIGVNPNLKSKALSTTTWPNGILFREFKDSNAVGNFWNPSQTQNAGTPPGGAQEVVPLSQESQHAMTECTTFKLLPSNVAANPSYLPLHSLGRTELSTMDDLGPPAVVEPFLPATSSRPGPTCGCGAKVFQTHHAGKYKPLSSSIASHSFTNSSGSPPNSLQQHSIDWRPTGRNGVSSMEALTPLATVAYFPPAAISRPVPVCKCGNRVFQPPEAGKYDAVLNPTTPDPPNASSQRSAVLVPLSQVANSRGTITTIPPVRGLSTIDHVLQIPCGTFTPRRNVINYSSRGFSSAPGRIVESTLEALKLSDSVLPNAASALHSRPGPLVGCSERVFRTASAGKYHVNGELPLPDACSNFSITNAEIAHPLRIYYQNVRGLRTKVDSFFLAACECDYDVIVLTETWLDDRFYNVQLFGNNFSVYRTDRNSSNSMKSIGGGVLIAVSTRWNSYIDPTLVSAALEQLWIRITTPRRIVSVGVIYIPPSHSSNISCIRDHVNSIGAIVSNLSPNDFAVQFGDYNQPMVRWCASVNGAFRVEPLSVLSVASATLIDGFALHSLSQMNGVSNSNGRFLDLVLTNDAAVSACTVSEAIEPLIYLDVDHPALEVLLELPEPIIFEDFGEYIRSLDFRRADYNEISAAISRIDWRRLDSADCVDDAVEFFSQTIMSILVEFVPTSRRTPKPPWSNGHLRRLKRFRSKALRKYCQNRSYITKREFNRRSTDYRKYNRFLYRRYVCRTQSTLRRNPKQFWSFVNSKRKEVGLPQSVHLGDQTANSEPEKCNLFAQHFMSSFNEASASPNQVTIAINDSPCDVFEFRSFRISEHTVNLALRKLKLSFAAGPDGIPASVLKLCSEVLLCPLTKLFNMSLHESKFPEPWKFSYMFPVHKKGDKRNVQNYRGITSLCCCSKVFEIIINEALFSSCKNYISTAQHGFYPKRSVTTNLTEFVSLCIRTMDSGGQVDAVYTDLKAAFDRVDHCILLSKLEKLGVSESLISWFRSYLINRSLSVRIGASCSEVFTNTSGVPQGSNLGPLLFSLFINELSLILPPGCRLFYADDVKMYRIIKYIGDCEELQLFVNRMQTWCSRNFLTLSVNKCHAISFHRTQEPIVYDYSISGHILERVQLIKDLGVTLDRELTFKPHYNNVLAKANRQLGFIFKISEDFRDPLCLRALYCSLVRSILEFGSVVWCPYQACWIARFESVQKKFVRYTLRHLPWRNRADLPSYEDRCRLLGIGTLEHRRRNAQALFAAKIITSEIDSPALLRQLNFYAPERVMRQRNFLYIAARNRQYGSNEPILAIAVAFNEVYSMFDFNVPLNVFMRRLS